MEVHLLNKVGAMRCQKGIYVYLWWSAFPEDQDGSVKRE